jgi:hypothetical protein
LHLGDLTVAKEDDVPSFENLDDLTDQLALTAAPMDAAAPEVPIADMPAEPGRPLGPDAGVTEDAGPPAEEKPLEEESKKEEEEKVEEEEEEKEGFFRRLASNTDPYTVMLAMALAAVIIGALCLLAEWGRYDYTTKVRSIKPQAAAAGQSGLPRTAAAACPIDVQLTFSAVGRAV